LSNAWINVDPCDAADKATPKESIGFMRPQLDDSTCNTISHVLATFQALEALLEAHQYDQYWQDCLTLLHQALHLSALSLCFLEQPPSAVRRTPVRMGNATPALIALFDQIEAEFCQVEWAMDAGNGPDAQRPRQQTMGGHTVHHHWLCLDGTPQAVLSWSIDPGAPHDAHSALILSLAHLAMERGVRTQRLHETQRQLERAMQLHQVAQAVTSSLDLTTVFHQTTELAARGLNAQAATLFRIDWARHELVFMITKGMASQILEEKRMPLEQGIAGRVALQGRALIVNDPTTSPYFNAEVDVQTGFKTRNILCVPLRIHERTVGVIEVLNKAHAEGFTEEDVGWLDALGRQIAIAIHNAQLYQNLQTDQERLIKAQEAVRHHLARELHDNTAQTLSAVTFHLELARGLLAQGTPHAVEAELEQAQALVRQTNREIRTLLFELHPLVLESRGLVPALYAYHRQLNGSLTSAIHLEVEPVAYPIAPTAASAIFSIVQEAVNNIRKHAQAANLWIRLYANGANLHFEVEDDGVGFDANQLAATYADRGSFGLHTMQERTQLLRGHLQIFSPRPARARGTLVRGVAPLTAISQEIANIPF
jgi:signal transduction histidine kinase